MSNRVPQIYASYREEMLLQDPSTYNHMPTIVYAAIYSLMFPDTGSMAQKFAKTNDKHVLRIKKSLANEVTEDSLRGAFEDVNTDTQLQSLLLTLNGNNGIFRNNNQLSVLSVEAFRLLQQEGPKSALNYIETLPEDYNFETRPEGMLFLLLVSIQEEQWSLVTSLLSSLCLISKSQSSNFFFNALLGEITRQRIPEEYWPWMMTRIRAVTANGKTYYCLPFLLTDASAKAQFNYHSKSPYQAKINNFNAFDYIHKKTGSDGRQYVSKEGYITAMSANAMAHVHNEMQNVVNQLALAAFNFVMKGKYTIYFGPGCVSHIKVSKRTLLGLGSMGFIISENSHDLSMLEESIVNRGFESTKLKSYGGILSISDGSYHALDLPEIPDSLIEALTNEIKQ